jgi:hypothetical protein
LESGHLGVITCVAEADTGPVRPDGVYPYRLGFEPLAHMSPVTGELVGRR